jgi:hypothetical protein
MLGLIEVVALPKDPNYSTLLQLLPLLLLVSGIWFVISQYQRLGSRVDKLSFRLRELMVVGWVAVFGVNAGIASLDNMSTVIFHKQLPYYFQGISLAQKIIALAGIFLLGTISILALRQSKNSSDIPAPSQRLDFWEKPLTNIGFISLLLGVVLGLAQYWSTVVFAGFFLLLAGVMLYPVGKFTEKDIEPPDEEPDAKNDSPDTISSIHTFSRRLRARALGRHSAGKR